MRSRVTIGALLLVLLLPASVGARTGSSKPPFVGATLAHPAPPPDFALRDQHRRLVRLSAEKGKVVLLTFLYTHCPDVCPLTATNLNVAVRQLGKAGRNVVVLAVSVDPAGDTPAAVRTFVRSHGLGAEFHYLTGTKAKLASVWRAYKVTAVSRGAAEVDHTLYTLVIDRSGKARVLFDSRATAGQVAHDVRLLLG